MTPVMLSKTYAALRSAQGVSDEQALEASEEIASFDRRLLRLEIMLGLVLTGVFALVVRAFSP